MNNTQPYMNCLVLLQTFEIYWAYYSISNGRIYASAARKSARDLCAALRETADADGDIMNSDVLSGEETVDPAPNCGSP